MNKSCIYCSKTFFIPYPSWATKAHCSVTCARKAQINRNLNGLKLGRGWNKGQKGKQQWHDTSGLRPHKVGYRAYWMEGENNHNWKGGITNETQRGRKWKKYGHWRKAVFKRDDYTCQICKERGGKLNADHIKPWAEYPELRFKISNGRTLCISCHKRTSTYGNPIGYNQHMKNNNLRAGVSKS